MTDFQLGLLGIGAAAVFAVLVYNRAQERRQRREAERAFASRHRDALLDEPSDRQAPAAKPARRAEAQGGELPDTRLDYVVELEIVRGTLSATVLENWKALEHRFAGRALLAGSDGGDWREVLAGDVRSLKALRAALQIVSRSGVASDAELLAFRAGIDTLGAELGARVSAPEMRQALEAARALDQLCADADIQIALHVAGGQDSKLMVDPSIHPYAVEERADGVSFILDVARTPDPTRAFEAMASAAVALAAESRGRLVDDNGSELDQRALAAISAEVDAVRSRLAASGIEPGSPLALRLFS
jgi:uncharacterized glyoxalase superfamily protein PhnB